MSPNLSRILKEVEALDDVEREELRNRLDGRSAERSEDDHRQLLRARGVVITVPPKPTPEESARFKTWRPITMPGGSLSDELIRDRR